MTILWCCHYFETIYNTKIPSPSRVPQEGFGQKQLLLKSEGEKYDYSSDANSNISAPSIAAFWAGVGARKLVRIKGRKISTAGADRRWESVSAVHPGFAVRRLAAKKPNRIIQKKSLFKRFMAPAPIRLFCGNHYDNREDYWRNWYHSKE